MPLSRTVLPSADVENKSTTYVCTSLCSLAAAGSLKFLSLKTSPEQNSSAWETRPALQATDKSAVATRDPWQSVELGWQQITGVLAARHPSLAPFFTVAASEGDQQRCATPKTFKLLETRHPMAEWTRIPKIESERGVTAAAMAGRETPLELNLEARPLLRRVVDLVVHSSKRTGRRPGDPPSGSTKANASRPSIPTVNSCASNASSRGKSSLRLDARTRDARPTPDPLNVRGTVETSSSSRRHAKSI